MKLQTIRPPQIELVAGWLAQKENYQWLDFGNGHQVLTPVTLALMLQREIHLFRTFDSEHGKGPIGLVAFSDIDPRSDNATLWYVLGDKRYQGQGHTSRAVSRLLTLGFSELKLHAVKAWTVAENVASQRVLQRNHFQLIGRQRQCHELDGRLCDRLWFDLLASEHKEI